MTKQTVTLEQKDIAALVIGAQVLADVYEQRSKRFWTDAESKRWYETESKRLINVSEILAQSSELATKENSQ